LHERSIRELTLAGGQIEVGQPLTDFSGLLTGTPVYLGAQGVPGGVRNAI
jgi:circadian clock protein KaiC